jgi:hypothetical protein
VRELKKDTSQLLWSATKNQASPARPARPAPPAPPIVSTVLQQTWRYKKLKNITQKVGENQVMTAQKALLNPALPQRPPKFSIGDEVVWFNTTSRDCGIVIARIWSNSSPSCKTKWGWHYLVKLSPCSISYGICFKDWGFEEDLMLVSDFIK